MAVTNTLVFSIDDLRSINNWGHFTSLISAPNIDRLAAQGTSFEHAVTQVPLCNPSRTSVWSGQQPTQTGVFTNTIRWFEMVDPASTLPAVLKAAGVHVAMYGKNFHGHAIPPEDAAILFDDFLGTGVDGLESEVARDGVFHSRPYKSGRYDGPLEQLQDERTAAAAVDFLQTRAPELDQPFFLSVGISKPHLNWWVPDEYYDLYDQAEIRDALEASLADGTIIPGEGEYFDVPEANRPRGSHPTIGADMDLWVDYIHAYLASISYADAKVGEVLDALEANPDVAAETAILLWSDHGYHLGDKDHWGKFKHWKESTEVPFIFVDPTAPGGRTAEQIVSLVDIFPTILDAMNVEAPAGLPLSGDSLMPIVGNPDVDWYDPSEGRGVALTTIGGSFSVRARIPGEGDFRYTRYVDGSVELYDLDADPNEHVNRIDLDTGSGLTPEDERIHDIMQGLLGEQLDQAGVLLGSGDDPVAGTGRSEMLITAPSAHAGDLIGGGGDDVYLLLKPARVVEAEGGGVDAVLNRTGAASYTLPDQVEIAEVQGGARGNGLDNTILAIGAGALEGREGDDTLQASASDDVLRGDKGEDLLYGNVGADAARGNTGDDVAWGDQGADSLYGDGGADQLFGGAADDLLVGGSNSDRMFGGKGSDAFFGGAGGDHFDGGPGGDHYRFANPYHWAPAPDVIATFDAPGGAAGDLIDLSEIDANQLVAGDQAFVLGAPGAVGSLWLENQGASTLIRASANDDTRPEVRIVITDGPGTRAADYTAHDFDL